MKIILCGYHWVGCKALDLLIEDGHEVFVYTHNSSYDIPDLVKLCKKNNISYSLDNISKSTLPFNPDLICSIYYRYIIDKFVIDSCSGKIFNLHPSLLPRYRGCSSLTWAIINGEKETGFTYHYINEGCDTGNIIFQKNVNIESWDTQQSLYQKVMFKSMEYFKEILSLVNKDFLGTEQSGESSFYKRGCPHNGKINEFWDEDYIERFIRAMYYPPLPPAEFKGHKIFSMEDYLIIKEKNIKDFINV